MSVAPSLHQHSTPLDDTESQPGPGVPAPFTSRILAAFIDYLMLQALLIATTGLLQSTEFLFIPACAISLLYFGIGNSHITGGSTLGKRAFGLRVLDLHSHQNLSIPRSLRRCCFLIVLPVLLIELPPLYFRQQATVGSPYLLDSPMALVLIYFLWNASRIFVSSWRRAGHDVLSGSLVLQIAEESDSLAKEISSPKSYWVQTSVSISLGLGLWLLSVTHAPAVAQIHRLRYLLENRLPVRIISLQSNESLVYLQLLNLNEDEALETKDFAAVFCRELITLTTLPDGIEVLRIEIFHPNMRATATQPAVEEYRLSARSCETLPGQSNRITRTGNPGNER